MRKSPVRLAFAVWLFASVVTVPVSAASFDRYYDCALIGETWFAWDLTEKRFSSGSHSLRKEARVKITDLNTAKPKISGQYVTEVIVVSRNNRLIRLMEMTGAGTPVTWTLFAADPQAGVAKPVLISTKAYEFVGPATFTAVYECQ